MLNKAFSGRQQEREAMRNKTGDVSEKEHKILNRNSISQTYNNKTTGSHRDRGSAA